MGELLTFKRTWGSSNKNILNILYYFQVTVSLLLY